MLSLKNVRPPVLMFLPLLLGAVAASGQIKKKIKNFRRPHYLNGSISILAASQLTSARRTGPPVATASLEPAAARRTSASLSKNCLDTGRFADVTIDAEPAGRRRNLSVFRRN